MQSKEEFKKFILGSGFGIEEKLKYQTFSENNQNFIGTFNFEEAWDILSSKNLKGAEVAVSLNLFKENSGRKKEDVIGYRFIVLDSDNGDIKDLRLKPTFIVKTKRGFHYYYKISRESWGKINELEKLAKEMAKIHGCDLSSGERNRVYRCPGFLHQKDSNNKILITILEQDSTEYSLKRIEEAYPGENLINLDEVSLEDDEEFFKWYNSMPYEEGVRNNTLFVICNRAAKESKSAEYIKKLAMDYSSKSNLPKNEALKIYENTLKKHLIKKPEDKLTTYFLAKNFIASQFLSKEGDFLLKYYKGIYFTYQNGFWKEIEDEILNSLIVRYIYTFDALKNHQIKKLREDVFVSVQSMVIDNTEDFSWSDRNNEGSKGKVLINLKNGLLDVEKYLNNKEGYLLDHSPKFFSTIQLPFEFNKYSICPIWLDFLDEIFEDEGIKKLIQEWFGYNLIADTSMQKFLILYGQGANGKGVLTLVLQLLLGKENVSHLSLEAFSSNNQFILFHTFNKLANITNEINDVTKTSEGILKAFVSGDYFTSDRKYKTPISFKPTARLTFTTNVLPRISDRSDGIARRLIIIPMSKQFLDEKKQDKRLVNEEFWLKSNELNGILLWALEGLRSLKNRGQFELPSSVMEAVKDYLKQANPTQEFLETHFVYKSQSMIPKFSVYKEYSSWMETNGYKPLGANNFANEVRKVFPHVFSSKNQYAFPYSEHSLEKVRDRAWMGLGKRHSQIANNFEQVEQLEREDI